MDRALVAFGIVVLMIAAGTGYLMYTNPAGLNPAWPMWMAMLVPVGFALAGLHLIAAGLDQPRLSSAMLLAIVFCLWAIVHWAAFFTPHIQCVARVSFLGAGIAEWYPSEAECRNSLRLLLAGIDALVVSVAGASAWHRYRAPRREPGR